MITFVSDDIASHPVQTRHAQAAAGQNGVHDRGRHSDSPNPAREAHVANCDARDNLGFAFRGGAFGIDADDSKRSCKPAEPTAIEPAT